jgi:hypothetical protein
VVVAVDNHQITMAALLVTEALVAYPSAYMQLLRAPAIQRLLALVARLVRVGAQVLLAL